MPVKVEQHEALNQAAQQALERMIYGRLNLLSFFTHESLKSHLWIVQVETMSPNKKGKIFRPLHRLKGVHAIRLNLTVHPHDTVYTVVLFVPRCLSLFFMFHKLIASSQPI